MILEIMTLHLGSLMDNHVNSKLIIIFLCQLMGITQCGVYGQNALLHVVEECSRGHVLAPTHHPCLVEAIVSAWDLIFSHRRVTHNLVQV